MEIKPKVIVICGPTASGKTSLSIELAKKINGEIISADSMQIYKEMNIGTAKVTEKEREEIKHYMIDIVNPDVRFSVAEYKKMAEEKIDIILNKNQVPIIVGGTGLYINSLIYNIKYIDTKIDEKYRKELEKRIEKEGLQKLYEEAYKIDPEAMENISKKDQKRIMRVLEIYHETGKNKTQLEIESRQEEPKYDYKVFAINWDREKLYSRINKRVDTMFELGLIDEVENILNKYEQFPTAMQGLGYKEVVQYINKEITKEEMIDIVKMETRRYAKRQITWFKKINNIKWINGENDLQSNINIILEEI